MLLTNTCVTCSPFSSAKHEKKTPNMQGDSYNDWPDNFSEVRNGGRTWVGQGRDNEKKTESVDLRFM